MDSVHLDDARWLTQLNDTGATFVRAVGNGNFAVYLYRPGADDAQAAHEQAEIYFVVSGSGEFESGFSRGVFTIGDALFVPAGEAHRFIGAKDALVWAAFFGAPIGGAWQIDSGASTLELTLTSRSASPRIWSARWTGVADTAAGPGLVIGRHMVCARLQDGVAGGIVIYDRTDDGNLSARWAHSEMERNHPGGGHARVLASGGEGFEGRFEIQYSTSDGTPIEPIWQLEIAKDAGRYDLEWRANNSRLRGTGVMRDNRLYAVWGQAVDYEALRLSVLNLPVAGEAGPIEELALDLSIAEPILRTWMRG